MIFSICSEPKVLEVMRIINLLIGIVKVVVPIILIINLMIKFTKAVAGDADMLNKVKKSAISNVIAAVLIFLTPTIITIIVGISFPNRDYKNCLEVKTREQINKIYIDKEEELVSLVEETINLNDYGNAKNYLQNIKDKDKVEEYSKRLGTVLEKIDELNKKPAKTVALSTGLGRDIVAKNELIEACKWVLHDEEVQILLGTCLPGPYRYPNAEDELPGGAVDISNGQAMALKTISLHEYQKGVFFGEENVQAAPNSRYAFMIIYKTVFLHNTVWRVINNELTFGKFKQIYYTAGSCSQNYRNSQRVSKYDSGIFKAEIDDTVEQTRYLVLANEDGETTDATYHSFTGIEQQIEAEGAKGTSFVDILEKVIKSGNDDAYNYRTARVYDCRNLVEDGTIEAPEGMQTNNSPSNIIYLGDSRIDAYKGLKNALNFNDKTESIYATSGAKYDEHFFSNMEDAKKLINSNKNKTYAITVNYGVNAPGTYRGFCDSYVDFVSKIDKKNKFIIVSVNPFDESKSVYYQLDDRNEVIEEFNKYMKSTCISRIKEKNPNSQVYYCDVYGSIPLKEWVKRKYISDDGIHYTTEGYKYIYNYTKKCVSRFGG